jgi:colicin import membrane protein
MGFPSPTPGNQTGVGSTNAQTNTQTTTQTGNQTSPTGGKGGGYGENPYATAQPQTPSQNEADNLSYKPLGGNVFGYNMNRLASRMDPSASLPPPQQASTTPPQYQPFSFDQSTIDYVKNAFGGKGGGAAEEPQAPSFSEPEPKITETETNPFGDQFNRFDDRFSALEERLNQIAAGGGSGSTSGAATDEIVDTGETTFDLPEKFEEFKVGQTAAEKAAADAKAAEEKAKIDPTTGEPRYQFGTYEDYDPSKLVGFSKQQVSQLYGQKLTQSKADVAEARRMQKAAKTPEEITAANRALVDANKRLADYTAAQKQAISQVGKTGYQTREGIATSTKAAADAKAKAAEDAAAKKKAEADAKAKASEDAAAKKKADADAKAKASADAAAKKKAEADAKAKADADKKAADADKKAADAAKKKADADAKAKADEDKKAADAAKKKADADAKAKADADKKAADAAKKKADADAKAKADADKKAADAAKKAEADAKKKAEADAKAKAAADKKAAEAAKKAEAAATKAAAKTTKKNAAGGVIHKGMSSNLKKQLGTR